MLLLCDVDDLHKSHTIRKVMKSCNKVCIQFSWQIQINSKPAILEVLNYVHAGSIKLCQFHGFPQLFFIIKEQNETKIYVCV